MNPSRIEETPVDGNTAVDDGMYYFIIGDMSVFALLFGACLWEAARDRVMFTADASELSMAIGFVNTLLLLWSSYSAAMAVQACRAGTTEWLSAHLRHCLSAAGIFVVLKSVEYATALHEGHGLTSSSFFTYYFVLTGLHLLHIAIGSALLSLALAKSRHGILPSQSYLESSAAYWHMVDLLWLLIFSLLYVGGNV